MSPTRVRQDQRNLSAFYKWAHREEIISANPLERIPRVEVDEKPARVMEAADLKALLDACKGSTFNDLRDTAIIRTLCLIGTPRMGELRTLTLDAIDLRNDLLSLAGKTGRRNIPRHTPPAKPLLNNVGGELLGYGIALDINQLCPLVLSKEE